MRSVFITDLAPDSGSVNSEEFAPAPQSSVLVLSALRTDGTDAATVTLQGTLDPGASGSWADVAEVELTDGVSTSVEAGHVIAFTRYRVVATTEDTESATVRAVVMEN